MKFLRRIFERHTLNFIPSQFVTDLKMAQRFEAHFKQSADTFSLDTAIDAWNRILEHPAFSASGSRFRVGVWNDASVAFLRSYWAQGNPSDLSRALDLSLQALSEAGQDLPSVLNTRSLALLTKYRETGDPLTLDKVITNWCRAVALLSEDSQELPLILNNLATALVDRYYRTGDILDLEEAISNLQRAVSQTNENWPDRSMFIGNLAATLRARYNRTGNMSDLEEAVVYGHQAVKLSEETSQDLPKFLTNLSLFFYDLYKQTGKLSDLEEAISFGRRAVTLSQDNSSDMSILMNNMALCLSSRGIRIGNLSDISDAIDHHRRALELTESKSPNFPMVLANLVGCLVERYDHTQDLSDLEDAINFGQRAVMLMVDTSPDLPSALNNLAGALSHRFTRRGEFLDNDEAIKNWRSAVGVASEGLSDLPRLLTNLATGLSERFAWSGKVEDLDEATNFYSTACIQGELVATEVTLQAGQKWARWAVSRFDPNFVDAATAGNFALEAIDALFAAQLSRAAQESWLKEAQGIHTLTAYALARQARPARFSETWQVLLRQAVETVERGQARLLAQALEENRADLARLAEVGHAELFTAYQANLDERRVLLARLEDAGDSQTRAAANAALRANRNAREGLIEGIRAVPGFEDFLAKPGFGRIAGVVEKSSFLIYLMATLAGGLALVVHNDRGQQTVDREAGATVTPVWLDDLTEDWLRALVYGPADDPALGGYLGAYDRYLRQRSDAARQGWFDALDDACRRLWDAAMGPLAAALHGLTAPAQSPNLPIPVTLIPTGLLGLLPLHAAWTEALTPRPPLPLLGEGELVVDDTASPSPRMGEGRGEGPRRYFLDDFAVAYAASAIAWGHSRARAVSAPVERLLAVAEPWPVSGVRLPNAQREVAAIADLFPPGPVLAGEEATRGALLAALPGAHLFHFSGHGNTAWGDPLESTLWCAGDERLTVRDLLALRLPDKRLALLSACETGIPGRQLPDESVNLPAALVQAGFAGAVASLWSVYDISTAMLVVRFYHHWQGEGQPPAEALRAAQRWLRDTSNREKAVFFGQFVPDLRRKMAGEASAQFANELDDLEPEARAFAHPVHWAAFTLTGA